MVGTMEFMVRQTPLHLHSTPHTTHHTPHLACWVTKLVHGGGWGQAPEIFQLKYNWGVDIYALGMIVLELITKEVRFDLTAALTGCCHTLG